jgi:hypothetical protein
MVAVVNMLRNYQIGNLYMTNSKWWYSPYIISDKANDLIPELSVLYPSAAIRKASTVSLDIRRVFVNISLDYNEDASACCRRKY